MNNAEHAQNLLNAEQARLNLAGNLHDMNVAGESLLRHGKHQLKSTAVTLGAAALGGLVIGVAVGRVSNGRRANSVFRELLGRATAAFASTLATQLLATLVSKRS